MIFSIVVSAKPDSATCAAALAFCRALLAESHTIAAVYFLGNAVEIADRRCTLDSAKHWTTLITRHRIAAHCCAAAVHSQLSAGSDRPRAPLRQAFQISGLGQLLVDTMASERVVQFGNGQ